MPRGSAVLVPGYRGTERQPILVAISKRLEDAGIATKRIALPATARPSRGYEGELAVIRAARDEMRAAHAGPFALVGRSFGGRMCAFFAEAEPPEALAIVSHPISPAARPRPRDEAALGRIQCPTLVVQGDRDDLGPLEVLQRIARSNPLVEVHVLTGASHDLGAQERVAADVVARWVAATLGRSG